MELREEGAVGDVVEALRVEACALDEVLHHLNSLYLGALLVHDVHEVLAVLSQVLLRHSADGVGLVDDVELHLLVVGEWLAAIDGKVGTHDYAKDEALVLVLHGVHELPRWLVLGEGDEVGLDRWVVHEADAEHAALLVADDCLIYREAVDCHYACHKCVSSFLEISKRRKL